MISVVCNDVVGLNVLCEAQQFTQPGKRRETGTPICEDNIHYTPVNHGWVMQPLDCAGVSLRVLLTGVPGVVRCAACSRDVGESEPANDLFTC